MNNNKELLNKCASIMGKEGGRNGRGDKKMRGDFDYYSKIGKKGGAIKWKRIREKQESQLKAVRVTLQAGRS